MPTPKDGTSTDCINLIILGPVRHRPFNVLNKSWKPLWTSMTYMSCWFSRRWHKVLLSGALASASWPAKSLLWWCSAPAKAAQTSSPESWVAAPPPPPWDLLGDQYEEVSQNGWRLLHLSCQLLTLALLDIILRNRLLPWPELEYIWLDQKWLDLKLHIFDHICTHNQPSLAESEGGSFKKRNCGWGYSWCGERCLRWDVVAAINYWTLILQKSLLPFLASDSPLFFASLKINLYPSQLFFRKPCFCKLQALL